MSDPTGRKDFVNRNNPKISVKRQAELLSINRTSVYRQPPAQKRISDIKALRGLPPRQREALVLRYYGDLSEAEIADAMGISKGAVKSHTARGMAALRMALEQLA